jgi:hypothetical protein
MESVVEFQMMGREVSTGAVLHFSHDVVLMPSDRYLSLVVKCDTVFVALVLALCIAWVTASLPQLLELHVSCVMYCICQKYLFNAFAVRCSDADCAVLAAQLLS